MAKGKPFFDSERCKGCELCVSVCPEKILKMTDAYNSQGHRYPECIDEEKCTACTFCAIMCPDLAIQIYRLTSVT